MSIRDIWIPESWLGRKWWRWKRNWRQWPTYLRRHWLVVEYLVGFAILALLVVIHRWWQMEHFYFNHGLFDMALWKAAHWQSPLIDHFGPEPILQLSDHFSPSLYLLVPLYWLTDSYWPLVLMKVMAVISVCIVMYIVSVRKLRPVLPGYSRLWSLVLMLCFTWFIGLQNAIIGDFALEFLAIVGMSLVFLGLELKSPYLLWVALLFTLGVKESMAAFVFAIGAYMVFQGKWKHGLAAMIISVGYAIVITKWVVPSLGAGYIYFDRTDPLTVTTALTRFFWPPIKLKTMLISTGYFGWLPLLSGPGLIVLVQDLYVKFVFGESPNWDLGLYYSLTTSVILYWVSLQAVAWLATFSFYKQIVVAHLLAVLILLIAWTIKMKPPLLMGLNLDFYRHTPDMVFLRRLVAATPDEGLVMTQNNLAPYLLHTHQVRLLRDDYERFGPDVVVVDIRDGQNPNNFWPAHPELVLPKIMTDPNYQAEFITTEQIVFRKVAQ